MKIDNYVVEAINRSAKSILLRQSTLGAFLGRKFRSNSVEEVNKSLKWAQWKRVKVLFGLRGHNTFVSNALKMAYVVNCPPRIGCRMRRGDHADHRRRCNHARICPWCWANLVVSRSYDRLIEVLGQVRQHELSEDFDENDNPLPPKPAERWHLPEKSLLTISVQRRVAAVGAEEAFRLLDARLTSENTILKEMESRGAILLGAVEPLPRRQAYVLRWGLVSLWPSGSRDVRARAGLKTRLIKPHWDRRHFVLSLLPLFNFPTGMWWGPPARVAELLRVGEHVQLLRTTGVFRRYGGQHRLG